MEITPAPGYIAPPLDGVWATAPYLHNGSVPDLRTLLDSERRPDFWMHGAEPRAYDPEILGWRHVRLEEGKEAARDPDERAMIYDGAVEEAGIWKFNLPPSCLPTGGSLIDVEGPRPAS